MVRQYRRGAQKRGISHASVQGVGLF
jgi:hypothetical protein